MRTNGLPVRCLVSRRRILDAPGLATTGIVQLVHTVECTGRKSKLVVEDTHERHVDVNRFSNKRLDSGLHSVVNSRWVGTVDRLRVAQSVVFGHVDELYSVELTGFVDRIGTSRLVPGVDELAQIE